MHIVIVSRAQYARMNSEFCSARSGKCFLRGVCFSPLQVLWCGGIDAAALRRDAVYLLRDGVYRLRKSYNVDVYMYMYTDLPSLRLHPVGRTPTNNMYKNR